MATDINKFQKQFFKRYIYVTDKGTYKDTQRSIEIAEDKMLGKIKYALGPLYDTKTALSWLTSMQQVGQSSAELNSVRDPKARQALREALDEAYALLELPLKRYSDGITQVIFESTKEQQLRYIGTAKDIVFQDFIRTRPAVLEKFKAVYWDAPCGEIIRSKYELHQYEIEMYRRFCFDSNALLAEAPSLVAWDRGPAFRVLNSADLVDAPTPTWDEFLARLEPKETFMAYVWSVFEPKNFGRQAMWMFGEGGDGKSTALRAIANYMGTRHTLTIGIGSYDKNFFFGEAYAKRLAIYPDCKNAQVLRKERIKQLLGKDIVPVDNKHEKVFSAEVYAKLFVASNWMPQINYQDASERTRLLVCKIKRFKNEFGDPDFELKLTQEMGAFLYKCREMYAQECPNGMNLRVSAEMQQIIKTECSAIDADLIEQFINEKLEVKEGLSITKTKMNSELKEFFSHASATGMSTFAFNDLLKHLNTIGIKMKKEKDEVSEFVGIGIRNQVTRMGVVK